MRSLSSTLQAAQESGSYSPLVKVALVGANSYTYTYANLLDVFHSEAPFSQKAKVTINNYDQALTDIDFRGYVATISWGATTSAGDEYSACAPLVVIDQHFDSREGRLSCRLDCIGYFDLMALDEASADDEPTGADTDTVKDIIREIVGDTGVTHRAAFNHTTKYDITFGADDALIDAYQPKEGFAIYVGDSRTAKIRFLLDHTTEVARFEDDGDLHIFVPTTTGTSYDSEYTLAAGHKFFSQAYRKALVIPNKVKVQSYPDETAYSGTATSAASFAILPIQKFEQRTLASNAQAANIAAAMISHYEMIADGGSANIPMNFGSEVYDYVKVTDSRQGDSRTGNIGTIHRHWNPYAKNVRDRFYMYFSFGNWEDYRTLLKDFAVYNNTYSKASRLNSKYLNVSHLTAQSIEDLTLDDMPDGTVAKKVLSTDVYAGHIKLSSVTVIDGSWYDESGVNIDADTGINIYGSNTAFTTSATKGGDVQCYVGSNGFIYAGGGNVALSETGLYIAGGAAYLQIGASGYIAHAYGGASGLYIVDSAQDVNISANSGSNDLVVVAASLRGFSQLGTSLGETSYAFKDGYIGSVIIDSTGAYPNTNNTEYCGKSDAVWLDGYFLDLHVTDDLFVTDNIDCNGLLDVAQTIDAGGNITGSAKVIATTGFETSGYFGTAVTRASQLYATYANIGASGIACSGAIGCTTLTATSGSIGVPSGQGFYIGSKGFTSDGTDPYWNGNKLAYA